MVIFTTHPTRDPILRLRRLAQCLGIESEVALVTPARPLPRAIDEAVCRGLNGFVFDLDTLAEIITQESLDTMMSTLFESDLAVLFFVSTPSEAISHLIRRASAGAVQDVVRRHCPAKVSFPDDGAAYSRQLCSQSYARRPGEAICLTTPADSRIRRILLLDGEPALVQFTHGKSRILIWTSPTVFDMDRPLATELEFEEAIDAYIPGIIFLRDAFSGRCWHNPESTAGLVIDDPLLAQRYGFIAFKKLLESARRLGYRVTLAFIPWNHWRTRQRDAHLFSAHSDCFSICVHGCDHIADEFRSTDYDTLADKNYIAIERMKRHETRTGLCYEPLFVCPEEQCSLEAWKAFADTAQFVAMLNTGCMPRNLTAPTLRAADLLTPAQDSFFGFPIFKRHYWSDTSAFAMALFLGKPAVLVEHHEFFRDDCTHIEDFVRRLHAIEKRIRWEPLIQTVTTAHWRRTVTDKETHIRFFTRRFELFHKRHQPHLYHMSKRVGRGAPVEHVLVNNVETPFSINGEFVCFEVSATATSKLQISIGLRKTSRANRPRSGWGYHAAVAGRRVLSEFRDNIIARNSRALKTTRALLSSLRLTGRSRLPTSGSADQSQACRGAEL